MGARGTTGLGRAGEDLACRFLEGHGLEILDRNWHDGRRGELDVIVGDPETGEIVVVEVKTRTGSWFGTALAAVDGRKFARLRRLAAAWLHSHDAHGTIRFDIIGVTGPRIDPELVAECADEFRIQWVRGVTP